MKSLRASLEIPLGFITRIVIAATCAAMIYGIILIGKTWEDRGDARETFATEAIFTLAVLVFALFVSIIGDLVIRLADALGVEQRTRIIAGVLVNVGFIAFAAHRHSMLFTPWIDLTSVISIIGTLYVLTAGQESHETTPDAVQNEALETEKN